MGNAIGIRVNNLMALASICQKTTLFAEPSGARLRNDTSAVAASLGFLTPFASEAIRWITTIVLLDSFSICDTFEIR